MAGKAQARSKPMVQGRWAKVLAGLAVLLPFAGFGFLSAHGQSAPGVPAGSPFPATSHASQFDQPLGWLQDARRNFGAVKDYACTLSKRESINGKLSDEHIIDA